jgi:type IV secretion system protein VirB1
MMDMAALDFLALFAMCAPQVHPTTLNALVAAESDFQIYAVHVNGTEPQPPRPASRTDAAKLVTRLIADGKSVDVGLGQINSKNFDVLGLTPESAFDPCTNISAAGQILTTNFERAAQRLPNDEALTAALSAYNTGNETGGIRNGYVQRVLQHAEYVVPAIAPAPAFHRNTQQSPVRLTSSSAPGATDWSTYRRAGGKAWDVYGRN